MKHERVKVTKLFKYLAEIIRNDVSNKEAIGNWWLKREKLNFATEDEWQAKIRHPEGAVKLVILCTTETSYLPNMEKLLKIERRILRNYEARLLQKSRSLWSNKGIYEGIEHLETAITKRRLWFHEHMFGMDLSRMNQPILDKIFYLSSRGGADERTRSIRNHRRRLSKHKPIWRFFYKISESAEKEDGQKKKFKWIVKN